MKKIQLSSLGNPVGAIIYYSVMLILLCTIVLFSGNVFLAGITLCCIFLYTLVSIWLPFVYLSGQRVIAENVFFRKRNIELKAIIEVDKPFVLLGIVRIRLQSGKNIYFFSQSYQHVKSLIAASS